MQVVRAFRCLLAVTIGLAFARGTPAYSQTPSTKVTAVAIDPQTPTTIYAATYGDGVFKSLDSGTTWTALGPANVNLLSLAVDPATPTTLYAGDETGTIHKSTDVGATWTPGIVTGPSSGCWRGGGVLALAIDPQVPSTIFSATESVCDVTGDLYKSTDAGLSFTAGAVSSRPVSFSSLTIAAGLDGGFPIIYAGHTTSPWVTTGGVVKSTDGGATWNWTSLTSNGNVIAVAADPLTPTTVYAVGGTTLFKSLDGGDSWHASLTGGVAEVIAVDPANPAVVYAGGAGIYKSTDAGATWNDVFAGIGAVSAIAIDPVIPSTVYAGTSIGVYKTTDGGVSWNVTGLVDYSGGPYLDVPRSIPGGTYAPGDVFVPLVPDDGAAFIALWSSNPSVVSVPGQVTVWGGFYYTGFTIYTGSVTANTPVEIFAVLDGRFVSVVTVVTPVLISDFRVDPTSVSTGVQATGTVSLSDAAPSGGAVIALASTAPSVATVPTSVTVAPGASSATFTISTHPVDAATAVTIVATYTGATLRAAVTVNPSLLSSVSVVPTTITGGASSSGTVTLSGTAPTGGVVVTLASSNTAAATVPASVTVPAGAMSASFAIYTNVSCATATATVSASYGGVTRSSVLTVTQAPADTIAIQRADYFRNRRLLRVSATNSISTATLQVFVTSSKQAIGTLTNDGGASYSGDFSLPANPQSITVRSSSCGSATRSVTVK